MFQLNVSPWNPSESLLLGFVAAGCNSLKLFQLQIVEAETSNQSGWLDVGLCEVHLLSGEAALLLNALYLYFGTPEKYISFVALELESDPNSRARA